MDHSPKGEAVAQPNQWRSWERPHGRQAQRVSTKICEWSRWEPCDIDPRLQAEPVGIGESINLKARPRLLGCVTAAAMMSGSSARRGELYGGRHRDFELCLGKPGMLD
jgi:hypothetical protein